MFVPLLPVGIRCPCWAHVLDNSGGKFVVPILDEFFLLYTALFSHSSKMRIAWKLAFGRYARSHSATRWYSMYEVLKEAFDAGWIVGLHAFLTSPLVQEFSDNASVVKMVAWYIALYYCCTN